MMPLFIINDLSFLGKSKSCFVFFFLPIIHSFPTVLPSIILFKDLNVRPETIKLLEENIGKTLSNIHHSRILYDPPPRILETKAKINKWDLIKLKSFCTTKETISKMESQAS